MELRRPVKKQLQMAVHLKLLKLKEDSSKNLAVNDVAISIVAETIPKRSHESVCDKTKDFPFQYSSQFRQPTTLTVPVPPPHMEILEALERQTDSMNTSEQSVPVTNRVNEYEEDQLGKTTYSNKLNQRNVIEPTVVDGPSDNPSTTLPSRKADEKKKDNKRSTSSSAYKPPFEEKWLGLAEFQP
ncbi:hypothetical protein OUZ56_011284 [Daphnia magna]|uniref:Uncharacterized protein n=1 Tax=Daphnia magna TaxID=35525 RepID=A0ABQ9YZY5_9CRUS|nr:hypothetical protein OUZ56_011284 [Daphnia magna]